MKQLRTLLEAKNKKIIVYLGMVLAVGAFMMLMARIAGPPNADESSAGASPTVQAEVYTTQTPAPAQDFLHVRALESRLEEFFTLVEGAGRVRVMVSLPTARETVFAVDGTSSESFSSEVDAQGGTRETRQTATQEQTVMVTDRTGTDRPLVLREVEPSVEGIVIIAEGGDSPFVRDALTRAARAVLGLDAHMVQVLTMAR